MITLGLSGLFTTEDDDYDPATMYKHSHDAAACLLSNGTTLAAIEEERLNRDKHTFRFPIRAVRECVRLANIAPHEIDNIAFYFEEKYVEDGFSRLLADDPQRRNPPVRTNIIELLKDALGHRYSSEQLLFQSHHECHAASAFYDSGYGSALILVSDGNAERDGVSLYRGRGSRLELLTNHRREHSLGHFYTAVTTMLGYRPFDEYKVMGLAAFGNLETYGNLFSKYLELSASGKYSLPYDDVFQGMIDSGIRPRRADEPLTQAHKDLAAAAQKTLEAATLHILEHWSAETGCDNLCIAGGVAQNTTLNGRILASGLMKSVYIPPAAHDAGAALGAAMLVEQQQAARMPQYSPKPTQRFTNTPFCGKALVDEDDLRVQLDAWHDFIEFEKQGRALPGLVAHRLTEGDVVGWVQGRSEFGPRALGNRSILADPRPVENRDRINRLIKEREDYRPFAPVVAASHAHVYFDLTDTDADHRYMGFVVNVREDHRRTLGATTHVDGTSRIQILEKADNPLLWELINEFGSITNVPVLLNTSFNNSFEPIVDSAYDAIATFVTARLDLLAIGPYLVRSKPIPLADKVATCKFELCPLVTMTNTVSSRGRDRSIGRPALRNSSTMISPLAFQLISEKCAPQELDLGAADMSKLCKELCQLWNKRFIRPLLIGASAP